MTSKQHILQVSELTRKVRFMLESEINVVWLCGEISNFIAANSGHWYLSLKDAKSQVKCAMFKGNNRYTRIKPENGQQVLVKARVSLYEPRGDFQLIIEQMEDAGEGLLRQKFEQLKAKLTLEGLFDVTRKQLLAPSYTRIGIVTSPTGAAVKDIISVLKRRSPHSQIVIYPALVQGEQAAQDISMSIAIANARSEVDVLIVGRGGGSLEDLWCFNEEQVVRAIAASKLPIISAVGHEIDTTLSDYAADIRAATPSAAAELISGDITEQSNKLLQYRKRLILAASQQCKFAGTQLAQLNVRLQQNDPQKLLQAYAQQNDELNQRLLAAMSRLFASKKQTPLFLQQMLSHLTPDKRVKQSIKQIADLDKRLSQAGKGIIHNKQQAFARAVEQLNIVSPLATIARGYSITRDKHDNIIRRAQDVNKGDAISVQISDATITATVEQIEQRS